MLIKLVPATLMSFKSHDSLLIVKTRMSTTGGAKIRLLCMQLCRVHTSGGFKISRMGRGRWALGQKPII